MSEIGGDRLEESMRETFSEIQEPEHVIEEVSDESPDVVEEPSDERPRDEKGRFISAKGEEDVDLAPEPEPLDEPEVEAAAEEDHIEEPVVEDPDPSLVNPPPTWTMEAKGKWSELPTWARAEVLRREDESLRGVHKLKEELEGKAHAGESLQQVVEPYMPLITAEGGTPETAVQEMLNSAYILRTGQPRQKADMALQLAQQYGFVNELFAIFQNGLQNYQPQAHDPRIEELERKIEQQRTDSERQRDEESARAAQAQIDAFANAKDDQGRLLYPYFHNLENEIAIALQSGHYQDLESAYNAAVSLHPETRAQQATLEEQKRQAEAKERARKAEKANKANSPSKGKHVPEKPAKPTGSVDDTMHEIMASMNR